MAEEEDTREYPEDMKAKKGKDYSMVRLKPSTLNRLKCLQKTSDSINNSVEDILNYYEANNPFLHSAINRFEEDMLSDETIRYIFPYSQNLHKKQHSIYRLYNYIRDKFSNVTFVKYEYSNQMVGRSQNYNFVFYTEKNNIRRPFFMIKSSVDKISGYIPLGPDEKVKSSYEDFVGWMPLFEAFVEEFRLHRYFVQEYPKSLRNERLPENTQDNERFIMRIITQSYEKSRGMD